MLINAGIFAYTFHNLPYFVSTYGVSFQSMLEGKYYTLITSMFIHSSIMHIVGNMTALFFIGMVLEKIIGKGMYLFTYFLGGLLANFLIIGLGYFGIPILAVGASASISSLIGLGAFRAGNKWMFSTFSIIPIPMPLMIAGAIYFVLNIYGILTSDSPISFLGHLTGILTGSIIGLRGQRFKMKKILIFAFIVGFISLLPYLFRYVVDLWK